MANFRRFTSVLSFRNASKNGGISTDMWNVSMREATNDFAFLSNEWNTKILPLSLPIPDGRLDPTIDAFRFGLSGAHLWLDAEATAATNNGLFFNSIKGRPKTIKEVALGLYSEIAISIEEIQNLIPDDSNDLSAYLNNLRIFVGATDEFDDTPTYTSNVFITPGASLEEAIGELDNAMTTFSSISGTAGSVFFADDPSGDVTEDNANFFWDNTAKRLGLGTNTPTAPLEIASTGAVSNAPIVALTHDTAGYLNFTSITGTPTFLPTITGRSTAVNAPGLLVQSEPNDDTAAYCGLRLRSSVASSQLLLADVLEVTNWTTRVLRIAADGRAAFSDNGSVAIDPNALVALNTDDKALLLTRLTTASRTAINATAGLFTYDSDTERLYFRDNTDWQLIASGAASLSNNPINSVQLSDGIGGFNSFSDFSYDGTTISLQGTEVEGGSIFGGSITTDSLELFGSKDGGDPLAKAAQLKLYGPADGFGSVGSSFLLGDGTVEEDVLASTSEIIGASAYGASTLNQDGADIWIRGGRPATGGGEPGNVILNWAGFPEGYTGLGTVSPNEMLTVAGNLSLEEQGVIPGFTPGFGKVYILASDPTKIWFLDSAGNPHELTNSGLNADGAADDIQVNDGSGGFKSYSVRLNNSGILGTSVLSLYGADNIGTDAYLTLRAEDASGGIGAAAFELGKGTSAVGHVPGLSQVLGASAAATTNFSGGDLVLAGGAGDGSGTDGNVILNWDTNLTTGRGRTGLGLDDPNELLTLDGVISLYNQGAHPATQTDDFGKVYVNNNKIYFQDDDGIPYDLTDSGTSTPAVGPTGSLQLSNGAGVFDFDTRLQFVSGTTTLHIGEHLEVRNDTSSNIIRVDTTDLTIGIQGIDDESITLQGSESIDAGRVIAYGPSAPGDPGAVILSQGGGTSPPRATVKIYSNLVGTSLGGIDILGGEPDVDLPPGNVVIKGPNAEASSTVNSTGGHVFIRGGEQGFAGNPKHGDVLLNWDNSLSQVKGRTGVGTDAPNELLTLDGVFSLSKQGADPSDDAGFGKLYAKDDAIWFLNDNGDPFDLTDTGESSSGDIFKVQASNGTGGFLNWNVLLTSDGFKGGPIAGNKLVLLANDAAPSPPTLQLNKTDGEEESNFILGNGLPSAANLKPGSSLIKGTSAHPSAVPGSLDSQAGDLSILGGVGIPNPGAGNKRVDGNLILAFESGLPYTEIVGRVGVGTDSPNELLTLNGYLSLSKQSVDPTDDTGFGKLYPKDDSVWFLNDSGDPFDLLDDGQGSVGPENHLQAANSDLDGDFQSQNVKLTSQGLTGGPLPINEFLIEANDHPSPPILHLKAQGINSGAGFTLGDGVLLSPVNETGTSVIRAARPHAAADPSTPESVGGSLRINGGTGIPDPDAQNKRLDGNVILAYEPGLPHTEIVGKVGIGTGNPQSLLTVEGLVTLKELNDLPDPAPGGGIAGYGQIFIKNADKKPWFKDSAGTEYNLVGPGSGLAGTAGAQHEVQMAFDGVTLESFSDFTYDGNVLEIQDIQIESESISGGSLPTSELTIRGNTDLKSPKLFLSQTDTASFLLGFGQALAAADIAGDSTIRGASAPSGADPGSENGGDVLVYGGSGDGSGTDGNVILCSDGTPGAVGRTGIGMSDPNEILTVEGVISLRELPSDPDPTTGYGKLFVKEIATDDSRIFFHNDEGDEFDLTAGGGGGSPAGSTGDIQFNTGGAFDAQVTNGFAYDKDNQTLLLTTPGSVIQSAGDLTIRSLVQSYSPELEMNDAFTLHGGTAEEDEAPATATIIGSGAHEDSTSNTDGGMLSLKGGSAPTAVAGDGGNVLIRGGNPGDTGEIGDVILAYDDVQLSHWGNVGIGTDTPDTSLHVYTSASSPLVSKIENPTTSTVSSSSLEVMAESGKIVSLTKYSNAQTGNNLGGALSGAASLLTDTTSRFLIGSTSTADILVGTNDTARITIDGDQGAIALGTSQIPVATSPVIIGGTGGTIAEFKNTNKTVDFKGRVTSPIVLLSDLTVDPTINLTLGEANSFLLKNVSAGSIDLQSINTTGWTEGSIIVLRQDENSLDNIVIKHAGGGGNLRLDAAQDHTFVGGLPSGRIHSITLQLLDGNWYELDRSQSAGPTIPVRTTDPASPVEGEQWILDIPFAPGTILEGAGGSSVLDFSNNDPDWIADYFTFSITNPPTVGDYDIFGLAPYFIGSIQFIVGGGPASFVSGAVSSSGNLEITVAGTQTVNQLITSFNTWYQGQPGVSDPFGTPLALAVGPSGSDTLDVAYGGSLVGHSLPPDIFSSDATLRNTTMRTQVLGDIFSTSMLIS